MEKALVLFGTGKTSPNLRWATQFDASDPFVLVDDGKQKTLWVNGLELESARAKAAPGVVVRSWSELSAAELKNPALQQYSPDARLLAAIFRQQHLHSITVEPTFPVGLTRELEAMGFGIDINPNAYTLDRRIKSPAEVQNIAAVMRATADATRQAIDLIAAASVIDGILYWQGKPLSGDDLTRVIETRLYQLGYLTESTITCGAPENASPHMTSSPVLRAGLPIILDVFPYDRRSGYWGDMTRTVVKGSVHPEVQRMYDAVLAAQLAGLALVRPGVTGAEIDAAVCKVLADCGFGSVTYDKVVSEARMNHSTGHGVGIEIHEAPSISRGGKSPLQIGDVITIEPGLYHPKLGGIRIEDTVVVTKNGYRNLTPLGKTLQVGNDSRELAS